MAYTIRKIQRKTGIVYSAIIKNQRGEHLKSKTFQRKGDAETWAKRIEADAEKKEALGLSGAGMTFGDILDETSFSGKAKTQATVSGWRIGGMSLVLTKLLIYRRRLSGKNSKSFRMANANAAMAKVKRHCCLKPERPLL